METGIYLKIMKRYATHFLFAGSVIGLFLISRVDFTVFHLIVELYTIIIAASMFVIMWNSRQYLDNISEAQAAVGEGAPEIVRLRHFYNHVGFLEPMAGRVRDAYASLPEELRETAPLLFTAHSIPMSMAQTCRYVEQLTEACERTAKLAGRESWRLVYQSRSGPPGQPWLEPDIGDALREVAAAGGKGVGVAPIGVLSDHMVVVYDLDHEAAHLCEELGLTMARAGTVGTHPRFIEMIRELVEERMEGAEASACAVGCCPAPAMVGRPA